MGKFQFSNFQKTTIHIDGVDWPTVEHYFQAMKSKDPTEQAKIRQASTPGKAKRAGRKVKLRPDWGKIKEAVMEKALRAKFTQHTDHKKALISTKTDKITEYNTWHDNEWGECTCRKCSNKIGKNKLGKLLMKLREEINGNLEKPD